MTMKYDAQFARLKMKAIEYQPDESLEITADIEIEAVDVARRMILADLEEYGAKDFLNQKPSDISGCFTSMVMDTSAEQLDTIILNKDAEDALDELGLGEEQSRIDMVDVAIALHNNYSKGMVILSHYLLIFEYLKESDD
jgi:hypothetical protein